MKRMILRQIIASLLITSFIISGCSTTETDPLSLQPGNMDNSSCDDIDFQVHDMNKSITIEIMEMPENTLKPNTKIYFWLENKTDKEILFPVDINIEIFKCRDGQWEKIQNRIQYLGDTFILSTSSFHGPITGFVIKPVIKDTSTESVLRVYVQGELLKKGNPTGKTVGAYSDVVIGATETQPAETAETEIFEFLRTLAQNSEIYSLLLDMGL